MKLGVLVLLCFCGYLVPVESLDNDTVITIESRFFFKELLQMWSVYFFRSKPVTRISQSDNETEPNGSSIPKTGKNSSDTEPNADDQSEVLSCRLSPVNYWNYRSGSVKIPVVLQIDRVPLDKEQAASSGGPGTGTAESGAPSNASGGAEQQRPPPPPGKREASSRKCTFILIYAKWCRFSMATAGAFNALGRAFPQLEFLALAVNDFQEFRWNLHTSYVPRIKLYWGNKAVREFQGGTSTGTVALGNGSSSNNNNDHGNDALLDELVDFVFHTTGQLPVVTPVRTAGDLAGPVSTVLEPASQFWLATCWVLTVLCSLYLAGSTASGRLVLARLSRSLLK